MLKPVIIFGTKEIASLAHYYFQNDSNIKVVAFVVDDEFLDQDKFEGKPVVPMSELSTKFPSENFNAHVAISYKEMNQLRERKFEALKRHGYFLVSYVSSSAVWWPDLIFGENCFILENQTLQPNVSLGDNVMLWSGNHVGHGSKICSHTYLSSHVVVSGNCTIGKRCFFGVNCCVRDFTTIGDDCLVGMNSIVNKDLHSGSVVLANSSKVLPESDPRARRIVSTFAK